MFFTSLQENSELQVQVSSDDRPSSSNRDDEQQPLLRVGNFDRNQVKKTNFCAQSWKSYGEILRRETGKGEKKRGKKKERSCNETSAEAQRKFLKKFQPKI